MGDTPRIVIKLDKIVHNYLELTKVARRAGVKLTGVVKGVAGDSEIVRALVAAGLEEVGDSRLENFRQFALTPKVHKVLLRLPALSCARELVKEVDASLNAERATLEVLEKQQTIHEVMLMVELGDQREGIDEAQVAELGAFCAGLKYLRITGLGANFSCFAGAKPSQAKLKRLVELAEYLCVEYRLPIVRISGGNSSSLSLLYENQLPKGINHLRIGEGMLLGRETLNGQILPRLYRDAFIVEAEVLQVRHAPKQIATETGWDAFGRIPQIPEVDAEYRLLLNLGHQDAPLMELTPVESGMTVLGGSSDYLVLASEFERKVGDLIQFYPNYWSLLSLMTSPYVKKIYQT